LARCKVGSMGRAASVSTALLASCLDGLPPDDPERLRLAPLLDTACGAVNNRPPTWKPNWKNNDSRRTLTDCRNQRLLETGRTCARRPAQKFSK